MQMEVQPIHNNRDNRNLLNRDKEHIQHLLDKVKDWAIIDKINITVKINNYHATLSFRLSILLLGVSSCYFF